MNETRPLIHCDVVVLGGGPVGLLIAGDLALLGIDVVVVERHDAPVDQPRAGTLHARTVQSLVRRGLLAANSDGDPHRSREQPYFFAARFPLKIRVPETEGTAVHHEPQIDLERRFEVRARACGARLLRGCVAREIAETDDGVLVQVEDARGKLTVGATFLVGADGARSLTRQICGFSSETRAPTVAGLIGRVRLASIDGLPIGWNSFARGWTRIEPYSSGECRVTTFDFAGPETDRQRPVTREEFEASFALISGVPLGLVDAPFLARFSDFSRVISDYRKGRCLLAGDAAHVHFPIGGQGLNLGIQDALNLSWKLAAAVRRRSAANLLDSYSAERRAVALRVISSTHAQCTLMRPGAESEPLRALTGELVALPDVQARLAGLISGQEISYPVPGGCPGTFQVNVALDLPNGRNSSIAEILAAARPVLVIAPGAESEIEAVGHRWSDELVTVRAVPRHATFWNAALVRPDGYLAWISGEPLRHLVETLEMWFGAP